MRRSRALASPIEASTSRWRPPDGPSADGTRSRPPWPRMPADRGAQGRRGRECRSTEAHQAAEDAIVGRQTHLRRPGRDFVSVTGWPGAPVASRQGREGRETAPRKAGIGESEDGRRLCELSAGTVAGGRRGTGDSRRRRERPGRPASRPSGRREGIRTRSRHRRLELRRRFALGRLLGVGPVLRARLPVSRLPLRRLLRVPARTAGGNPDALGELVLAGGE